MANFGNLARYACFGLVALGFLVTPAKANRTLLSSSPGGVSGPYWTTAKPFTVTLVGGTANTVWFQRGTGTAQSHNFSVSGAWSSTHDPQYYWLGLSSSSGPVETKLRSGSTSELVVRWGFTSTNMPYQFVIPSIGTDHKVAWGGPFGNQLTTEPVFSVQINPITGESSIPLPPKIYGQAVLVIDNATGRPQTLKIGDETIELQPGYNAVPFYGEVDSDGFPMGLPDGVNMGKHQGADGQTFLTGRLVPGVESLNSPPVWSAPPSPVTSFNPTSAEGGPTLGVANGASTDYVTLPAGMTRGNNVPLPGGMTPGSPGLPAGVTPGTVGALPSGVVSGGSNHLPPGVSPGTLAGATGGTGVVSGGSGGSGGSSSGGSVVGGVGTIGSPVQGTGTGVVRTGTGVGEDGKYIAGPSMAGLYAQGESLGASAAESVKASASSGLGKLKTKSDGVMGAEGWKFWTSPNASMFGGDDKSWMNSNFHIGSVAVNLAIPPEWLALIRGFLLWGVKLWFVWAVIKLFMR